jgi:hypothetical protein
MRANEVRSRGILRQRSMSAIVLGALAIMGGSIAVAQYVFDPTAPDEVGPPGIRYFGSVKDEEGRLLAGATIALVADKRNFVFVTDMQGRFRGKLPLDLTSTKIAVKCWKAGFLFVRVAKRPGPAAVSPTVQVDCMLRREGSR